VQQGGVDLAYAPRILIVDDEPAIRRLFEDILAQDGYYVTAVGTGRHALFAIQDTVFDIIVVDMSLPDVRGPELLTQIRSETPLSKILAISGFMEGIRADAIAAGATAVLAKPFAAQQLQETVYRLIDDSCSWMGQTG
jgi:CheY-like chemotaxis protein